MYTFFFTNYTHTVSYNLIYKDEKLQLKYYRYRISKKNLVGKMSWVIVTLYRNNIKTI